MAEREAQKFTNDLSEPDEYRLDKAKRVYRRIRRPLLRQPGVTAVDIGYAVSQEKEGLEDLLSIRVHVENKLGTGALEQLARPDLTTKEGFPLEGDWIVKDEETKRLLIDGFPIDVVEARYFPSQEIRVERPKTSVEIDDKELLKIARSRVQPLVGGISIGNLRGQAGTLGAVVWDRTDGTACVLSNWHVLAGSPSAVIGQPCFQPAIFDGGKPSDAIASLKRWRFDRHGDAALAEISQGCDYSSGEILGLWQPLTGIAKPRLRMEVVKWGRSTGFTRGFIDGINLATNIEYGNGSVRYFEDQIHIAPLVPEGEVSARGDSGSIVLFEVDLEGRLDAEEFISSRREDLPRAVVDTKEARSKRRAYYAVGLMFAGDVPGSQFGEFAIASSMERLATLLEFSLRPVFVPRRSVVRQQPDLGRNGASEVVGPAADFSPGEPSSSARVGGVGFTPDPEVIGQGG